MSGKSAMLLTVALLLPVAAAAETPDEWVALGARVHGGFGAFIPLGIKIGLDAVQRLHAEPRDLVVLYYDSDTAPCACFADRVAIATYTSVGQRTLTIAAESAARHGRGHRHPPAARRRRLQVQIPMSALPKLAEMNKTLQPRGRYDAVMASDALFAVEPAP